MLSVKSKKKSMLNPQNNRTLLERCQKLIIPVINEVFGTLYTMDDEITLRSNEH